MSWLPLPRPCKQRTQALARTFAPFVKEAGFNYTGALSLGNVEDLSRLGLGPQCQWEAEAGLDSSIVLMPTSLPARVRVLFALADADALSGPNQGQCRSRLSAGGILSQPHKARHSHGAHREDVDVIGRNMMQHIPCG